MSFNTSAVIAATFVGLQMPEWIEGKSFDLHTRSGGTHSQHFRRIPVQEHAGGANTWSDHSSGVWAAEFDYVSPSDLEAWFRNLPWGSSDVATLTVEVETGDVCVVSVIGGRTVAVIDRPAGYHGPEQPLVRVATNIRDLIRGGL